MDNIQVETYSSHEEPKAQAPQESAKADTGEQLEMETSEAEQSDSEESSEESSEEQAEDSETSESMESEESDEDDSEEDEEDEDEPKKAAKKKSGFAKRVAKLKAKQAEAQREAEYWRAKALQTTDTSGESKEELPEEIPNPYLRDVGERPDPDDYESQDEYLDALTDWKIDVREAKKKALEEQTKAKTAAQKQAETFQSKVQEYAETVDDWEETLESVSDIQMNPELIKAIMTSEFAPQLMYDLSKNRSELERINQMDQASTLRTIGRLESKFEGQSASTSSKQETRRTTKAPKPPTPVGRNSSGATKKSIYDENLSQREYEEIMAERERKRMASSF